MSKLYNTFDFCSTNFDHLFHTIDPSLSKNQRNFFGDFFAAFLSSNSVNFDKIALSLSSKYPNIRFDSILKRISRFLNNSFSSYRSLFDNLIKFIFSNFKVKHSDNRVYISFDHIFSHDNFTIFMISTRGFPIYFNSFNGKGKADFNKAFKLKHIKPSLSYVHDLIKSIDLTIEIIFLADRWFGNLFPLLNFINNDLHDFFVFRCKDNFKIFNKEKHFIWTSIHHLPNLKYHSRFFQNLEFTRNKYKFNLTVCKSDKHEQRWFLISNVNPKRDKKFYA